MIFADPAPGSQSTHVYKSYQSAHVRDTTPSFPAYSPFPPAQGFNNMADQFPLFDAASTVADSVHGSMTWDALSSESKALGGDSYKAFSNDSFAYTF